MGAVRTRLSNSSRALTNTEGYPSVSPVASGYRDASVPIAGGAPVQQGTGLQYSATAARVAPAVGEQHVSLVPSTAMAAPHAGIAPTLLGPVSHAGLRRTRHLRSVRVRFDGDPASRVRLVSQQPVQPLATAAAVQPTTAVRAPTEERTRIALRPELPGAAPATISPRSSAAPRHVALAQHEVQNPPRSGSDGSHRLPHVGRSSGVAPPSSLPTAIAGQPGHGNLGLHARVQHVGRAYGAADATLTLQETNEFLPNARQRSGLSIRVTFFAGCSAGLAHIRQRSLSERSTPAFSASDQTSITQPVSDELDWQPDRDAVLHDTLA